jgi:hypothetical protein
MEWGREGRKEGRKEGNKEGRKEKTYLKEERFMLAHNFGSFSSRLVGWSQCLWAYGKPAHHDKNVWQRKTSLFMAEKQLTRIPQCSWKAAPNNLKLPLSPSSQSSNIAKLRAKPLAYGPLEDILDPNS